MALYQVNNFSGNLTRKKFGTMNSGMARIGKSHSLDPFTQPGVLSFNETATNLDPTHATIADVVVDGITNEESGVLYLYSVDRSGNVYKTNTSSDATTVITSSLGITLKYGGGIKIISYGGTSKLIVSHDTGALYMNVDGTSVNTLGNGVFVSGTDTSVYNSSGLNGASGSGPANSIGDTIGAIFGTSGTAQFNYGTLYTGLPVVWTTSTGSATPLVSGTTYYVIVKQQYFIQLATTLADALAGNAIAITFVDPTLTWQITTTAQGAWIQNIPHPISDEFFGGIFIGNGPDLYDFNIAALSSRSNRLVPTYPKNYIITSLEVDAEGRYMRLSATTGTTQDIITIDPTAPTQAPLARSLYWNGQDDTYDSLDPFTQTNTSSSFSFIGSDINFGQDFWGAGVFQSGNGSVDKMLAMKEVRAPTGGAITASSNLLLFGAPYYVNSTWRCGIFGFGTLDDQDQPSLYQLLGLDLSDSNTVCTAVGMLRLVQNRYIKSDGTFLTDSKLYVSTYETGTTPHANLYSFNLTPGAGTPNDGVYQTQTEQFLMQQKINRVVFYIQPTSSGVSFRLDLVDVDDTIPSGASYTYTFSSGADDTQLLGPLEVFEWTPNIKNFQGLGLALTNLGTVQPNMMQIQIETEDTDKAQTQLSS